MYLFPHSLTEKYHCAGGPRQPAAKCPQSAMENSSITCSCTATDMGEPAGRLVWQGADNKTLLVGAYGKSTVNYSLTVRNVDNGRRFTCRLEWTNDQSKWKSDDAVLDVLRKSTKCDHCS
ncbi:hypothetical protein BaRGS_00008892 [Batillaria attramentaria]|uniref:Ig-like domain-containing protein n=1 Tax=Batillaria attramentaria TaxID=370345 RepID=A0ABD0LKQ6_9CAEN